MAIPRYVSIEPTIRRAMRAPAIYFAVRGGVADGCVFLLPVPAVSAPGIAVQHTTSLAQGLMVQPDRGNIRATSRVGVLHMDRPQHRNSPSIRHQKRNADENRHLERQFT